MDEGVESVPDEEEAAGFRDGAVQHQQRCAVCDNENRDSRGERPESDRVEQVGRQGFFEVIHDDARNVKCDRL